VETRHRQALQEALDALEVNQALLDDIRVKLRTANEEGAPWDVVAELLRRSAQLSLLKARGEELAAALAEALAGQRVQTEA